MNSPGSYEHRLVKSVFASSPAGFWSGGPEDGAKARPRDWNSGVGSDRAVVKLWAGSGVGNSAPHPAGSFPAPRQLSTASPRRQVASPSLMHIDANLAGSEGSPRDKLLSAPDSKARMAKCCVRPKALRKPGTRALLLELWPFGGRAGASHPTGRCRAALPSDVACSSVRRPTRHAAWWVEWCPRGPLHLGIRTRPREDRSARTAS